MQKCPDVMWMNNSVLDFSQCAKIKSSKLLQELKDERLKGIYFIFGFTEVLWTKRQAKW